MQSFPSYQFYNLDFSFEKNPLLAILASNKVTTFQIDSSGNQTKEFSPLVQFDVLPNSKDFRRLITVNHHEVIWNIYDASDITFFILDQEFALLPLKVDCHILYSKQKKLKMNIDKIKVLRQLLIHNKEFLKVDNFIKVQMLNNIL